MRARSRRRKRAPQGAGFFTRERLLLALAICVGAFVIGYAVTALAFRGGRAPADVVTVPDLRELSFTEATATLDRVGLHGIVSDSFPNPNIPAGSVVAQTPLPGQEVSPETDVSFIVSTGPLRPEVPDVISMAIPLATRALQTAGFEVLVEEAEPGDGARGEIVEVVPAPGTRLALPATVRIRIGIGLGDFEMPFLVGMPEAAARDTIAALELELGEVVYESPEARGALEVVAQEPVPGDTVSAGAVVRLRLRSADGDFDRPPPFRPEDLDPRAEAAIPQDRGR